jgi:hypothetical protein
MKAFLIASLFLALSAPVMAQGSDQTADNDPATRDDVILYLRTMHSHDMMQKMMEVQSQAMQRMMKDQIRKEGTSVPADFDARMKKRMDELVKNMPMDEITQAMIPAYHQHFTKGDIQAMNTFYSSPVGQKVLEQLPAVMQQGMQAATPIISRYVSEWQQHTRQELEKTQKDAAPASPGSPSQQ